MALKDSINKVAKQIAGQPATGAPMVPPTPSPEPVPPVPPPAVPPTPVPPAPVPPPAVPPAPIELMTEVPGELLEPVPPVPPASKPPENDVDKNLAALRKKLEATESELAQLKAKQTNAKADPEVLKKLQEERDQALDRLAKLDLAQDPRFQSKYSNAEKTTRALMQRIASEFGADASFVNDLMNLSIKDRTKKIADEVPDAALLFAPHLARLDELRIQKENELADASKTREQLDVLTRQGREKAISEQAAALHGQVCRELEDAGFFLLKTVPGNEKWNADVDATKKFFSEALTANDPVIQARIMGMGAVAPKLLVLYNQAYQRVKTLEAQLKTLGGMAPTVTGRGSIPPPPAAQAETLDARGAAQLVARSMLKR